MSANNTVILQGNLTRDPQLQSLPSGTMVAEFGLAVNRRWKNAAGQKQEEVCFVDCRMYGKRAEVVNQYLHKGDPLLVSGWLQLDTWEGKDGQRRSKHRVVLEDFQFIRSPAAPQAQTPGTNSPPPPSAEDEPMAPDGNPFPF